MAASIMAKHFVLLTFSLSFCYGLNVPLVAWSYGDRALESPKTIISGQSVEANDIFKKHLNPFVQSGHRIFFFLQDELSIDDFTIYRSSFENLKFILSRQESFVFPSVLQKEKTISSLINGMGKTEEVFSSDFDTWSYEKQPSDNNVVIFHLEPTSGASQEGRKEIFKRNDLAMKTLIKKINLDSFSVVLTSSEPSQIIEDLFERDEILAHETTFRRTLLGVSKIQEDINFFNNSGNVYMYTSGIKFGDADFTNSTWAVTGTCGDNIACLALELKKQDKPTNVTKFSLLIEMQNDTLEWFCHKITVKVTMNKVDDEIYYDCNKTKFGSPLNSEIRAPIGMSYSCHDMSFQASKNKSMLQILGMQLQPQIVNGKFANAYSCVGFFTIEILTGIFVTLVLTLGLLFGISMMMNIQTQDRFDDPKGQMLSVPDHD